MLVLAHAGHWLPQLIYLVPLLVLVGVIVAGRIKDRREAAHDGANEPVRADREELGLRPQGAGYWRRVSRDELFGLGSAARAEANIAYDAWCAAPGRMTSAVYRAAEDRADAAEVALSRSTAPALAAAWSRQRDNRCARSCVVMAETGETAGQRSLDMSVDELRCLLDGVPDTRELVIRRAETWTPVRDAWRDAHEDAAAALGAWRRERTAAAYAAYRAAQDREDAAQDALAG